MSKCRSRILILLLGIIGAGSLPLLADTISTTTNLSIAPLTVTTGQTAVFTATVSPTDAAGVVMFTYSLPGQAAASVFGTLSDGVAGAAAGPIAAGTYSVQAQYLGRNGGLTGNSYTASSSSPAPLTVVAAEGPAESSFAGQYAFLFQGFSVTANPYASAGAGSFTADGRGHITAGTIDLVTPAAVYRQVPITGSYTLENSGQGRLTLASPGLPYQTMTLSTPTAQALAGVQSATATPYNGGLFGSLRIAKQTALTALPIAQFALQMAGFYGPTYGGDPAVLVGVSGTLTINGSASPSAILEQTVGTSGLEEIAYATPTFNSTGVLDATTGRFEMSLSNAGAYPCGYPSVFDLDAFALDSTHLFIIYLRNSDICGNFEVLSGTAEQ